MAHLAMSSDIRNELELETMVEEMNTVIISTYETSYLVKVVTPSDVSWCNNQDEKGMIKVGKRIGDIK